MMRPRLNISKPALLCVVPPYSIGPPAGIAYLLAYAKKQGCSDFGFLDLRLGVPEAYAPTYTHTGVFGEAYVMDVPDLPLVLSLVDACETGQEPTEKIANVLERYCRHRGMSESYLHRYLISLDSYFRSVAKSLNGIKFIGCSVWTSNFLTSLLFAAHLKRCAQPPIIVAGGPQVTESRASAAIALRSRLFDYVITGEGESSLLDLYCSVVTSKTRDSNPVPGTLSLDSQNRIMQGVERPLLAQHEIPVPSFDQMPLLSYQEYGSLRTVPYHLSRGCTDKCTFCSEWVFWRRFRPGNSGSAVAGIRELQKRYGAEYIAFTDSLLNGHPARLREFAEAMIDRKPRIAWSGFMRAQMDAETALLLKRAGCDVVFIGIESMSDETLMLMKKRRTELHNIQALRAFLGAGIDVVAGIIPGFPGDSRSAFVYTIEQIRCIQREFPGRLRVNIEPFIVSPGQPLFRNLEQMGLRGKPWDEDTLDLAPHYKDITASLFCTVEGSNQGVERMGRLYMAEAIESDEPMKNDPFEYKVAETLNESEFYFDHMTSGWFIGRLKGPQAWIFALIVNEEERQQIERTTAEKRAQTILAASAVRKLLNRIKLAHSIPPKELPRVFESGYSRSQNVDTNYQTSPYIVARPGNWHVKNRLIVVNYVTTDWWILPPWQAEILKALRYKPHSASSLQKILVLKGIHRSPRHFDHLLRDLSEKGILVIHNDQSVSTKAGDRTGDAASQFKKLPLNSLPVINNVSAQSEWQCHNQRSYKVGESSCN